MSSIPSCSLVRYVLTSSFNLGIDNVFHLVGMNVAAGPELAAAVTNAGGLGVIGGLRYTPKQLRMQVFWFRAIFQLKVASYNARSKQSKNHWMTKPLPLVLIFFSHRWEAAHGRQTYVFDVCLTASNLRISCHCSMIIPRAKCQISLMSA
jgi:NAD(P)H-dependent flavin oxidoreductase YrpB (nitropropane dioxygenase family)